MLTHKLTPSPLTIITLILCLPLFDFSGARRRRTRHGWRAKRVGISPGWKINLRIILCTAQLAVDIEG